MSSTNKKKKKSKEVDDETKGKLRALFVGEKKIINGFPFNINDYCYRDGKPVALLECKHRRRPNDGDIKCPAKSTLDLEGNIGDVKNSHNHRKNETLKEERAFHDDLKEASSASGEDLHKVFNAVRRRSDNIPPVAFGNKRSSMHRARSKVHPPYPKNLTDYANTLTEEKWKNYFKYKHGKLQTQKVGSGRDVSVMFYDPDFMEKLLENAEKGKLEFCFDATFNITPTRMKLRQFLTIMIYKGNHAIPFMYALMESKSTKAYQEILKQLCLLFPKIKELDPIFHLDFELASRNAILDIIPTATIQPCLFHFLQVRIVC
ncbi:hypothetical protein KQX54_005389 [Cotesia glomerata]|uniref:MULE transposase domain-containing protein n=1 Tax=Cotesia glomerata TaxID=32391 RepID=A0AAV7J1F1_COTGL|nr:hypothetical protein KQX54_005389 [Cotesia glomerata]